MGKLLCYKKPAGYKVTAIHILLNDAEQITIPIIREMYHAGNDEEGGRITVGIEAQDIKQAAAALDGYIKGTAAVIQYK